MTKEVYCVFTFQEVLVKIFFDPKIAESFKKVYVKNGYIKPYTIDDNIMGTVIENKKGEKKNGS